MISGRTRVFAILGSPVEHSLSPVMHTAAFTATGIDAVYVPLPCRSAHVKPLITALTEAGGGGNVTIPYKVAAAEAVDDPSDLVAALGACNTFWGDEDGSRGDNTDVVGIRRSLAELDAPATAWLVVGTGGSARAVLEAARLEGAALAVQSRSVVKAARFRDLIVQRGVELAEPDAAEVLINATPLGLLESDALPADPDAAPAARVALDLVYRRGRTPWIRSFRDRGVTAEDGRLMLVAQGAAAFECWFPGVDAPTEVMRGVVASTIGS